MEWYLFATGGIGEWTSFDRIKGLTGAPTSDDAIVADCVNRANAEVTRLVGMWLGPSTDALRRYDGSSSVRGGRRLWIPGGIRALSAVRIGGGTLVTQPLTTFLLRPHAWELPTGRPYAYIDIAEGSSVRFSPGQDNIELTGDFGYAVTPEGPASVADQAAVRMYQYRSSGGDLPQPTASKFIYDDDRFVLDAFHYENFAAVR